MKLISKIFWWFLQAVGWIYLTICLFFCCWGFFEVIDFIHKVHVIVDHKYERIEK